MRRHILVLTLVLAGLIALTASAPGRAATHRRALLVGITDYHHGREDDLPNLDSGPDVDSIKAALLSRGLFEPGDIKVCTTRATTTHQAIVQAIKSWLIDGSEPGDTVYFHYSGHGDHFGVRQDLKAEHNGLVPFDYNFNAPHFNYITDVELRDLLKGLMGRNVLLTFDCCHSASVTRGAHRTRGGRDSSPYWSEKLSGARTAEIQEPAGGDAAVAPTGRAPTRGEPLGDLGYVAISACRLDQLDEEAPDDDGHEMGPLSYALAHVLADPSFTGHATYGYLFERVTDLMARKVHQQEPVMEGNPNRAVFGAEIIRPVQYVLVHVDAGKHLVLDAGRLHGMTAGSTFAIYPPGTTDFNSAKPIARATVENPDVLTSGLKREPGSASPDACNNGRARETSHHYGGITLTVDASHVQTLPQASEIKASLGRSGFLAVVQPGQKADAILLTPGEASKSRGEAGRVARGVTNGLLVVRDDQTVIKSVPASDDLPAQVQDALEGEARFRYLKALENHDSTGSMNVQMKLVQVDPVLDAQGNPTGIKPGSMRDVKPGPDGHVHLSDGQWVALALRDSGRSPAYVTVLNLDPDGSIGPVFPDPAAPNYRNNFVAADAKWHTIEPMPPFLWKVGEPYGPETFKLIATQKETDFSPLLNPKTRGAELYSVRGADTPIGQLLLAARNGTRGVKRSVNPGTWCTNQVLFIAEPPLGAGGEAVSPVTTP